MSLKIIHSFFADSIKKQLRNKNLDFQKQEVKLIQELSFSALNLRFHEIITDEETDKIIHEIDKRLLKHLGEYNVIHSNQAE